MLHSCVSEFMVQESVGVNPMNSTGIMLMHTFMKLRLLFAWWKNSWKNKYGNHTFEELLCVHDWSLWDRVAHEMLDSNYPSPAPYNESNGCKDHDNTTSCREQTSHENIYFQLMRNPVRRMQETPRWCKRSADMFTIKDKARAQSIKWLMAVL